MPRNPRADQIGTGGRIKSESPGGCARNTHQHIAQIQTYGRLAWQVRSGYNQRSRAEAQIGRWKSVIGPKLRSRRFENQKTEAQIGVRALNRMT